MSVCVCVCVCAGGGGREGGDTIYTPYIARVCVCVSC